MTEKYPDRIKKIIDDELEGDVKLGFKTSYKPNATIPILWFFLNESTISLCSTHKSRGIFKKYNRSEIDSIRIKPGLLTLIHSDLSTDDLDISIPIKSDIEEIKKELVNAGYELI